MATVTARSWWIGGLPLLLDLASLCGAFWMVLNLRELDKMVNKSRLKDIKQQFVVTILTNHVYYMTYGDIIVSLCAVLIYLSFFINAQIVGKETQLCLTLAIIRQVGAVATTVWYCAMMWCNALIIRGKSSKIRHQLQLQKNICFLVVTICVLIPFFGNAYGAMKNVQNDNNRGVQCWIYKKAYFLTLYIPNLIILLFTVGLMGYALIFNYCKGFNLKIDDPNSEKMPLRSIDSKLMNQNKQFVYELMKFGVVFVIIWGIPISTRFYQIIDHVKIHFVANVLHHICVASYGLANFFVWKRSLQKYVNKLVNKNDQELNLY